MERLRHGAELALGAGGEAGGEAERGGGLRGIEAEQPGASGGGGGRAQGRGGVPALEVVGHVERLAEPGHDLDACDERIRARCAVGAPLLAEREQGGHQHRADVGVADLQHVVVVQRVGRRAVDQRSPGRGEPVRRAGDDRTARTPARDAGIGRARRGIVRAGQHAGDRVHEGAARAALRFLAPRAGRLGDPAPELERGAGRAVHLSRSAHHPLTPLALVRADGTRWLCCRNRARGLRACHPPGRRATDSGQLAGRTLWDIPVERRREKTPRAPPAKKLEIREWGSADHERS